MKHFLLAGALALSSAALCAQDAAPKPATVSRPRTQFLSPEVHADRRVTFRVAAPNARQVELDATLPLERTAMEKGEDGLWSVTIGPIAPGLYHYWIRVDGMNIADAMNPLLKPSRSPVRSLLEVPAEPPALHEFQDVPHGVVRMHFYVSKALGKPRKLRVYTPPGYRDDGPPLPVLYLYPGSTNHEGSWMDEGRAHFICDNLLAAKRCLPMLVVMPDIHALDPRVPAGGKDDLTLVDEEIVTDIIPLVDAAYRTQAERTRRALAGLSKGSIQALRTGIMHRDLFAWVGAFSGAPREPEQLFQEAAADPARFNDQMRLVWLGVGRDDFTVKGMESLHAYLDAHQIRHTWRLTEGIHEFTLWRPYLAEFVELLFRDGQP